MGKKADKNKDKAAALEEEARLAAKRAEHGEEEYQCTGILEQDFTELCTRAGLQEIPKVVARPHPHTTHTIHMADEIEQQAEKDGLQILAQIQSKYAYFRPAIQVELEHEDPKSTREIFIRSWKIEDKMLAIFAKCLPPLTHLQGIRLWKVGLTDLTFTTLLSILPTCPSVKTLVLEGNSLPERSFYKLITDESNLAHISLRNNSIDDEGARLISQAISTLKTSSKSLVSINLSYNHITDVGASYLADALRLNRSLLSLSLAHNEIGDEGAMKLAEILAPFALSHAEVVERRRLLLEKDAQERLRMPQRMVELKAERPPSHSSNTAIDKLQTPKAGKGAGKKKEPAKKEKEKEKEEKGQPSGGAAVPAAGSAKEDAKAKKEEAKQAKKAAPAPEQKPSRGKGAKAGTKEKRAQVLEVEMMEPTETVNPLLEHAEHRDGNVFLPGNRVLIYLNLIRNRITEKGLRVFLEAVQKQSCSAPPGSKGPSGLLHLSLAKNHYPPESRVFAQIQELMSPRDPLPKSGGNKGIDDDLISNW